MAPPPAKVFCIGFHKTGTKSMGYALTALGYRVCGQFQINNPNIRDVVHDAALEYTKRFDAFQDNPWPMLYRTLDRWYPDGKFILTIRPTDAWIRSVVAYFGETDTAMREWIYGVGHPKGHEDLYRRVYETHNSDVVTYFRDRPDDFIVMDLPNGDGWDKLCGLLGRDVPSLPFPHVNKGDYHGVRQTFVAPPRAQPQSPRRS